MNTERWERLNIVFHTAIALDPEQRAAYLDETCRDDAELRRDAERLIGAHERAGNFIDSPAIAIHGIGSDDSPPAVAVGQRFGPYRLIRELARGGMGAVYLAERADGQYEQHVAIKLIKRGLDIDLMLRRFRAERQILASLDHPNIARMLDGGTREDGQPFFVMEFIDGEPIDEYAGSRSLSIADRLRIFLHVCEAVAYAHRRGIIHRDLKPANILVTADGVPKLLDFGIAKVLTPDAPAETLSLTGLRLLTPQYASPEQVDGLPATVASDVYSLGVVLYELLSGNSPYALGSTDPLAVAQAVRTTVPERPSAATSPLTRRQLRGDIDTIVLAALRKEPERRYATVDELAADIRRHLDGMPISARRDSTRYRAAKFVRRNRGAVIATASAVLATSLLATAFIMLRATDIEPSLLDSGLLAERDRIVVSHFTDSHGDTLLAGSLTEAFRIDLTQSPHVRVLTPVQMRAALERMQHERGYISNDSVAREVAIREGAKAFVTGSIARLGGAYALSVQLIAAESGEALSAVRETAADSTELISVVGRASRAMRRRLGESLRDLGDMPALQLATTASLPALRRYTEGHRFFLAGDRTRAIELYEEAVALDPAFALAHSALAANWTALAEPGRAHAAVRRALAQRDRLPFRERGLLVATDAYGRADYATAIDEYSRMLERYPSDIAFVNNLALAHRDARNFAAAESLWHRALALDSTISVLYYGLHSALVLNGNLLEGRQVLDLVRRRFPDDRMLPATWVQQATAQQDWDEAEQRARLVIDHNRADTLALVDGYEQLAGIVMTRGRLDEAERHWRTQLAVSTASESWGRRLFGALQIGYLELRFRERPDRARATVDSVLALRPLQQILEADRPYESLARFYAELGDVAYARRLLAAADSNNRSLGWVRSAERAWTQGVVALAERRPREAGVALREAAEQHSCPLCPLPDLARAYDAAGEHDLALDTYEKYLITPWLWRYENDAIARGHALRRVGELHESRGDHREARVAYENLLKLWEEAEGPAARVASEVRTRLARLPDTVH